MQTFFEKYQRPLFAFLKSRGADQHAADDAVQEAMLEVWRTAAKFEGRSSAKTWLSPYLSRKAIADEVFRSQTRLTPALLFQNR